MEQNPFVKYATVVMDQGIDKFLDYGMTEEIAAQAKRGMRVEVPVKGILRSGYLYAIKDKPDYPQVKGIAQLSSSTELISDELFELALWVAKYYCSPLCLVLHTILPAPIRKDIKHKEQLYVMRAKTKEQLREHCEKIRQKHPAQANVLDVLLQAKQGILLSELLENTQGSRSPVDSLVKQRLLTLDTVRVERSPLIDEEYFQTKPKALNREQALALSKIESSLQAGSFATHLIHGVTGSGKTEIYLQAIDQTLKLDKGAIMLVPEISLTGQTIERFRSRFEGKIAILHHRLSSGERFDEWHKIRRGDAKIVIGARSAVFSPVPRLGLIIVDEEHDSAYKQMDSMPCYHARDTAVMRGKFAQATVILGSATPSIESYTNAVKGKYILSPLSLRADSAEIPQFTIVDMNRECAKAGGYTNFSEALLNGINERQQKGEQTILFLNRRGYHTTLLCQSCQKAVSCKHCATSLTFHLSEKQLACHLCGYSLSPPPSQCPSCKSMQTMKYRGVGTEHIQRALHAILPEIRTLRMDADTTRHKGSHQKLLRDFATGKADVLIGTQMIAKGLHFPEVTLVGVLNSDSSLNLPDFRASESVFQLITQVAGRAGRGHALGEVIVQTHLPENRTIQLAASQNYQEFYEEEIRTREAFNFPPFSSLAKLTFSGPDQEKTLLASGKIREALALQLPADYELHAVIPSGHAKIKDKYRFQLLIRGPSIYPVGRALEAVRKKHNLPKGVLLLADMNPLSTFF